MIKNLWIGASGMNAQMQNLDTISTNLNNINTHGYKKRTVHFADLLYQEKSKLGLPVNEASKTEFGTGVKVNAVSKDFGQGELIRTERELDMAIEGKGFFALKTKDGQTVYSRVGAFALDKEGQVISGSGLEFIPNTKIPAGTKKIDISQDGIINAVKNDGEKEQIGEIDLHEIPNPDGLNALGGNLFQVTKESGDAKAFQPGEHAPGKIWQGFLESSNVNIAEEMANVLMAQRAYQISSKTVTTADQMWSIANNIRR